MDCVFCAIVAGDIPNATVHEDEDTLAFLDINPLRPGHALVIPKSHAQYFADLDDAAAAALTSSTRRVVRQLHATLGTTDATIAINDGPSAGQEVPHVHVHIVPRPDGDAPTPIHALFPDRPESDMSAITALAERIRTTAP